MQLIRDIEATIREHFPTVLSFAKAKAITLQVESKDGGQAKHDAIVEAILKAFGDELKRYGPFALIAAETIARAGFTAAVAEAPGSFKPIVAAIEAVVEGTLSKLVNQSPLAAAEASPQTQATPPSEKSLTQTAPTGLKDIVLSGRPLPQSQDSKTTSQTVSGK